MTAKEARQLAEGINTDATAKQLQVIEEVIKKAAHKADFYGYYYENPTLGTQEQLVRLGYKVEVMYDQRDGYTTKISW